MKTEIEWNQDIINITTRIHQEFPELAKHIREMPVKTSEKDNEGVNIKNLEDYYHSLAKMVGTYSKTHTDTSGNDDAEKDQVSAYPLYPPSEDIYYQDKKEMEIDPNNPSKHKAPNEAAGSMNEKDFEDDSSGDDLDVPGAELDDQQERVGNEDEENNYYSLGGDNHNDLEEN